MRVFASLGIPGRSLSSGARKSVVLLATMVMLCGMSMPAEATEGDLHTVTIYFGGTYLVSNDYIGDNSPFKAPALVPQLHHCDNAEDEENEFQYKKFVDGKHYTGAFKADNKHSKTKEAGTYLDGIMGKLKEKDTLILNVVGNSRGAVSAIYFASTVAKGTWGKPNNERIVGINIIAMDPVPGDQAWKPKFNNLEDKIGWGHFRLHERITNYLGIYASDERSKLFAPVIPSHVKDRTRYVLARLRGSHQTHVGNLWNFGHSIIGEVMCTLEEDFNGWCLKGYDTELDLVSIPYIAHTVASELLMSPEWGSVRFANRSDAYCRTWGSPMDPDYTPGTFKDAVTLMNTDPDLDYLYDFMRRTAFLFVLKPYESWYESDCHKWVAVTTWKHNAPRCSVRVARDAEQKFEGCSKVDDVNVYVCPLEHQKDVKLVGKDYDVEDFWEDLWEMGYLPPLGDADRDGFDDDEDNCPFTYNPGQENKVSPKDSEGDDCDPIADENGPDNLPTFDYEAECTRPGGADIQLDGSGSTDPNGDVLSYSWTAGTQSLTGMKPWVALEIGKHTVDLEVEDPLGNTDADDNETFAIVKDTKAPELTCPEVDPVECTGYNGAIVEFEATATDVCDDTLSPGCTPPSGNVFALGPHKPKCSVTDDQGNRSDCAFDLLVEDTTPPVITGITEPIFRWPPNHKYETFLIEDFVHSVSDICTPLTMDDLEIAYVINSEADNAAGDGHTIDDMVIAEDQNSVDLRIERSGKNKPRIYTVYIRVTDGSGNSTTEPYEVIIGKK